MPSDLLSIGRSGATAARIALDVTAQNIANAATPGYIRRSVVQSEVATAANPQTGGQASLSGVRVDGIVRNVDRFRQAEVRRTGSDAARAQAEVNGLENIESSIELSGVFPSLVSFEGSLQQLGPDPTNAALRAAVVEGARTLAGSFNLAANSLDSAGNSLRFEARGGVDQVNLLAGELARVNDALTRASGTGGNQALLLDRRDTLLQSLSDQVGISTTFAADQTVEVRIAGATGAQPLVSGRAASPLALSTAADGTIAFALGGQPVTLGSGALAGQAQALVRIPEVRGRLDAIAAEVIEVANNAQAQGVALDGTPGQPLFSGSGAGDIAVALSSGAGLATAPAGAGANSRDAGNLAAFRQSFAAADPAGDADTLLFDVSSTVAARRTNRDALLTIAGDAQVALQAQAGVDLDQEAVNLVRFQQAFQASSRVIQVASDLFNTLLQIQVARTMPQIATGTGAFYDRSLRAIGDLRRQTESLQGQIATSQRLTRSSDDPVAASRLRQLSRLDAGASMTASGASGASSDLTLADETLSAFADQIGRARELAAQAASGTMQESQRAGLVAELNQIQGNLMALANTRDAGGNALFGGQVSGEAYVLGADGNAVYMGGASAGSIGLGDGLSVQRGLTGPEFLGFTRNGQPTDLMAQVKLLADGLAGADPVAAARDSLGALDDGLNSVATGQTLIGARLAWIDFTAAAAEQRGELRSAETEQRGGADLATSITQMQQLMVVLQASQTSFVRLASLSLFNALG